MVRVGVLTSGGDCPGLNAVIRAVVRRGERHWGDDLVGFHDGWAGVIEGRYQALDVEAMRGYLARGGTMLGTSRVHPWMVDDGVDRARATLQGLALDALVVIGGEGSLAIAHRAHTEGMVPVVGVPKTIDNDTRAPSRPSGLTLRCLSRRRPSIASTRQLSPMIGSWWWRSWVATSATSPRGPA